MYKIPNIRYPDLIYARIPTLKCYYCVVVVGDAPRLIR